jgi:hypothetical protein
MRACKMDACLFKGERMSRIKSFCEDDWYAPGYLAIDVGPMLIGIHNYRAMNDQNISGTYNWFMNNTHITNVDYATLNGAGMASALTVSPNKNAGQQPDYYISETSRNIIIS